MNILLLRWPAIGLAISLCAVLVSGCVVADGGYAYNDVGVWPGYYEPYGAVYGGWGPGYAVGPVRGGRYWGGRGGSWGGRGGGPHAFGGGSRGAPSIPSGGRGGGGRRGR